MKTWSDPAAEAYAKGRGTEAWRILVAGLMCFGALGVAGYVAVSFSHAGEISVLGKVIAAGIVALAMAASMFFLNGSGYRSALKGQTLEALEQIGLVSRATFRAKRYFVLERSSDQGDRYYIELDNGRVLCLEGQYLLNFAAVSEQFEILRHGDAGYVLTIRPSGRVLEPEFVAAPAPPSEHGDVDDGELLSTPYEQLVSQLKAR